MCDAMVSRSKFESLVNALREYAADGGGGMGRARANATARELLAHDAAVRERAEQELRADPDDCTCRGVRTPEGGKLLVASETWCPVHEVRRAGDNCRYEWCAPTLDRRTDHEEGDDG